MTYIFCIFARNLANTTMKKIPIIALIMIANLTSCSQYLSYTATIDVNGVDLFYIVEGKGKPVILLHGNGGSHTDLETETRQLAQAGYRVYALDSRGQGANRPVNEYHYRDMAEDTYQVIRRLGIKHPAVFGWSDGGNVALLLELMHSGTCSLIATSGANLNPEGLGALLDEMMEKEPNEGNLFKMMCFEPNMTTDDMKRIKCPALICAGENDLIPLWHTEQIAASIPQGKLHIVPDADHGSHIYHNPKMANILIDFFRKNHY